MSLESLIGVAYSFYTLACAVIFPVAAAVAVFACLRRAGTVRKILGYFISMPVYVRSAYLFSANRRNPFCLCFPARD